MSTITFGEGYETFNPDTFQSMIEPYDVVKYVGEDNTIFKEIIIGVRTANKKMEYSGELPVEYAERKLGVGKFKKIEEEIIIKNEKSSIVTVVDDDDNNDDTTPDEDYTSLSFS
jgi:hypothetical protein